MSSEVHPENDPLVSKVYNPPVLNPRHRNLLSKRLEYFIDLADYQANNVLPQNDDPYTKAYETSFAELLHEDPLFREEFAAHLAINPVTSPDILLKKAHKSFQYLLFSPEERDKSYEITDFMSREPWKRGMQSIIRDEDRLSRLDGNLVMPIMSNVSERGILLKLLAGLHQKTENVSVLELGSSLMHVLKRLDYDGHTPLSWQPIDVMRRDDVRGAVPVIDKDATERLNPFLASTRMTLRDSVGMDSVPFDRDEQWVGRALSDCRYLGQIALGQLDTQLEALQNYESPNMRFVNDDASTYDPDSLDQKFDIVYNSTWMYQADKEQVSGAIKNGEMSAKDDGLVAIQDFVRAYRPHGLPQFYKRWPRWTYGLWVKDMAQPDLGYQKYFTVASGRIEAVIPNERSLSRLDVARKLGLVTTGLSGC